MIKSIGALACLAASIFGSAAHAGEGCIGPFESTKYPVAHMVILDTATRCYMQWTVKDSSPEDVRCTFTSPLDKPSTRPDVYVTLSEEAYDAYLNEVLQGGTTNTSAYLLDHYFFSGFARNLTPSDGTPGC